jgi:hypothetical protein
MYTSGKPKPREVIQRSHPLTRFLCDLRLPLTDGERVYETSRRGPALAGPSESDVGLLPQSCEKVVTFGPRVFGYPAFFKI